MTLHAGEDARDTDSNIAAVSRGTLKCGHLDIPATWGSPMGDRNSESSLYYQQSNCDELVMGTHSSLCLYLVLHQTLIKRPAQLLTQSSPLR